MESYSSLVLRGGGGGKAVVGGSEKGSVSGGGGGSTVAEQQQRQALIPQSYEVFLIDARLVLLYTRNVSLSNYHSWFVVGFICSVRRWS
jgi:hypothetical protein